MQHEIFTKGFFSLRDVWIFLMNNKFWACLFNTFFALNFFRQKTQQIFLTSVSNFKKQNPKKRIQNVVIVAFITHIYGWLWTILFVKCAWCFVKEENWKGNPQKFVVNYALFFVHYFLNINKAIKFTPLCSIIFVMFWFRCNNNKNTGSTVITKNKKGK